MDEIVDKKVRDLVNLLRRKTDSGDVAWTIVATNANKREEFITTWEDASVVIANPASGKYVFSLLNQDGDAVLTIDTRRTDSTVETDAEIGQLYNVINSQNSSSVQLLDSLINRLKDTPPF